MSSSDHQVVMSRQKMNELFRSAYTLGYQAGSAGMVGLDQCCLAFEKDGTVCGDPVLGDLLVCYDHADRGPDNEPRNPWEKGADPEVDRLLRALKFVLVLLSHTSGPYEFKRACWEVQEFVRQVLDPSHELVTWTHRPCDHLAIKACESCGEGVEDVNDPSFKGAWLCYYCHAVREGKDLKKVVNALAQFVKENTRGPA